MALSVTKSEVFGRKIEVLYSDGTKEEIRFGVYQRKNAAGRTVEERAATDADFARLRDLAADARSREIGLKDGTIVEISPGKIEVEHPDGSKEEIENGVYERKDAGGRTVEERAATAADKARLAALAPESDSGGATSTGPNISGDDDDDDLRGGSDDDHLRGGGGDDDLKGRRGDDRLEGGSGRDDMSGGRGRDDIRGGGDADDLSGGAGDDRLRGGKGDDDVRGGSGDDRVRGDAGSDRVFGDGGDDRAKGGGGDDLVAGGSGDDRLWGGRGDDVFVFAPGGGDDKVHDFGRGEDRLDLAAYGFSSAAEAIGRADQAGRHVVIDLGGGDSVKLANTSLADLSADDFLL